jgi:tetratricopeptide (TPR) repeat protein
MSLAALERDLPRHTDETLYLYALGTRLNRAGRYVDADPLLRRAVGIDPHNPRYRDAWAQSLLGSGLATAAYGQLREFAGTQPDMAEAHLILGKFYFTQRSMARAAEEFERAATLDGRNAEAWSYLAGSREALNDLPKAAEAAEHAIRLRSDHAPDRLLYASLLTRTNRSGQAREQFEYAIRIQPSWAAAHREYASWLLQSGAPGDAQKALSEATLAVKAAPNDAQAQLALGDALARSGRADAAVEPLSRSASLAPDDPAPAMALSQALRGLGRTEESSRWEADYRKRQKLVSEQREIWEALRVRPNDGALHARMARLLGMHGDVAGAVRHRSMELHCALDAPQTLIAAANDLADGGHADAALPLAQRAVRISAANPSAHEALGNALLGLGEIHQAGLEYNKTAGWLPQRKAVLERRLFAVIQEREKNPPPAELAYREARRLERQQFGPKKYTPEVQQAAEKAVSLEPKNPNYLWYLLRVQMGLRQREKAIVTANQLLAVSPTDAHAHAMLALLLVDGSQKPAELASVESHLRIAGSDPTVAATYHYGMGLLSLARGNGAAAARSLRMAAELDPGTAVTFYKLSMAENMAGDRNAAARALRRFHALQDAKQQQANALSDLKQHPERRDLYENAARVFETQGLREQAESIRREAKRRFRGDPRSHLGDEIARSPAQ